MLLYREEESNFSIDTLSKKSSQKTTSLQQLTSLRGTKQPLKHYYQKFASFLAMTTRDGNNKKTTLSQNPTSLQQLTSLRGTKQPQNQITKNNAIATTHVIARDEATSKHHHKKNVIGRHEATSKHHHKKTSLQQLT